MFDFEFNKAYLLGISFLGYKIQKEFVWVSRNLSWGDVNRQQNYA